MEVNETPLKSSSWLHKKDENIHKSTLLLQRESTSIHATHVPVSRVGFLTFLGWQNFPSKASFMALARRRPQRASKSVSLRLAGPVG